MAEYIVDTTEGIYNARTTGEIVRCRDCVWGRAVEQVGCVRFIDRGSQDGSFASPYGYCAWGERRDSNGNRRTAQGKRTLQQGAYQVRVPSTQLQD